MDFQIRDEECHENAWLKVGMQKKTWHANQMNQMNMNNNHTLILPNNLCNPRIKRMEADPS